MLAILASIWRSIGAQPPTPRHFAIEPYRAFTRDFDVIVKSHELDTVLGPLSRIDDEALGAAWEFFQRARQGWRTKVHLSALEASARIRSQLSDQERADTVVAILIDHSGSMRGQSMLLAAASADVAQNFLRLLGADVEVLGFTTVTWKGGQSRKRWRRGWHPSPPGRLCDLLHIVYESRNAPSPATGGWSFRPMLRPDLPKENVDGEAIEWAASRLRENTPQRKILLVISDGAPVDDSTSMENDPNILVRHLKQVVHDLEAAPDINLAAVGIGFEVNRYYSNSSTVKTAEDLGEAVIAILENLMIGQSDAKH